MQIHEKIIPLSLSLETTDDTRLCCIDIAPDRLRDWCLLLVLLKQDLLTTAIITDGDDHLLIERKRHADSRRQVFSSVARTRGGETLHITQPVLDYWLRFFLLRYRDGYSTPDRLDTQIHHVADELGYAHFHMTLLLT